VTLTVPDGHLCEAPDCSEPAPRGATCSPRCRARKWKADTNYRDPRRRRPPGRRPSRSTRYAIVAVDGPRLEVLAFGRARDRARAERSFGIRDRDDLRAIAARALPVG
jgi:hypothetical protein